MAGVNYWPDFENNTLTEPLSKHSIAGICVSLCTHLLRKIKQAVEVRNPQQRHNIDQIMVVISTHFNGICKVASPTRRTAVLPRLNVTKLFANTIIPDDRRDIPYCTSQLCLKMPGQSADLGCFCMYIRMLYIIIDGGLHKITRHFHEYERWVADQSLAKCISEVKDLGTTFGCCESESNHGYPIQSITLWFTVGDNPIEHQCFVTNSQY